MSIVEKVTALLYALRREDIERLPPAERRRLAYICLHVAGIAEPASRPSTPARTAGVLAALDNGERST